MVHNEHLRRADELYEIRHDNKGNAIHVYIKDGEAIIYPTIMDMIMHQFKGANAVERTYTSELSLEMLYGTREYDYYGFKAAVEQYNLESKTK